LARICCSIFLLLSKRLAPARTGCKDAVWLLFGFAKAHRVAQGEGIGYKGAVVKSVKSMGIDPRCAEMLRVLRERYGVADERVLGAMATVRRDRFIPPPDVSDPFGDHPIAIGYDQTISQPFIVAHMTSLLGIMPGEHVLEVGTGSGYQCAVLSAAGADVDTVERIPELAEWARKTLVVEGFGSVRVHVCDGAAGWPGGAPYDGIIVTCAAPDVPPALVDQLAEDGRLVAPVGEFEQRLVRIVKRRGEIHREEGISVRFVPLVSWPGAGT
jgi:protein-L-isoaspartate(D-aspartate) O-methyltransferase